MRRLEQLRIDCAGTLPEFTQRPEAAELVFKTTKRRTRGAGLSVYKHFKPLLKQAARPKIGLYDLATRLPLLGCSPGFHRKSFPNNSATRTRPSAPRKDLRENRPLAFDI